MAKWSSKEYRLPENHGWVCKEGFKSFVSDRGAVRFDIPGDWTCEPGDNSFKFHDYEPPDDTCILEITVWHLNPDVDWTGLPMAQILDDVIEKDRREVLTRGEVKYRRKADFETAWVEVHFMDKDEDGRPKDARARTLIAKRGTVWVLITFAWWPEDAARVLPAWDEMFASLRLGEYVAMPILRDSN